MTLSRILVAAAAVLTATLHGLGFQDRGQTSGVIVQQRPVPNLQPLPTGEGSLAGHILDRETGAPLPGARVIVRLLGEATGQFSRAQTPYGRVLTAGPDGLFMVTQVGFGEYVVDVEVPGYTGDDSIFQNASRRFVRVAAGSPLSSETFRLSRLGSMSGRVIDERGRPQGDVAVMLLKRTDLAEPFVWLPDPVKALTNSDGRYQFTNVPRGEYVVGVYFRSTTMPVAVPADDSRIAARLNDSRGPLPRPLVGAPGHTVDGFHVSVEDSARRVRPISVLPDGRITAMASTYHPDVTSLADAKSISLLPGAHVTDLDIRLRTQTTARVSGILTGPDEAAGYVALRLMPEGVDRLEQAAIGEAARTITDAAGHFTFLGVPPGRYTLVGYILPLTPGAAIGAGRGGRVLKHWAKIPVEVTDATIADLRVPLLDPLSVAGRIEVVPTGDVRPPRPGWIRLSLQRASGQSVTLPMTTTITNGQFSLGPAFPDRYRLVVEVPPPWRVESIVADGRDITASLLTLVDHNLSGVVITLTSAGR